MKPLYNLCERSVIRKYEGEWGFRVPNQFGQLVVSFAVNRFYFELRRLARKVLVPLLKIINRL
jgi:hypothetical protein